MADFAVIAVETSPAYRYHDRTDRPPLEYVWTDEGDDALAAARGTIVGALLSVACWFGIYLLVTM